MFESSVEYCERMIGDESTAIGGQLSVAVSGTVVMETAFGKTLGRCLDTGDLHPGFCTTKPILGLAVGLLIDDSLVDLDDYIRSSLHPKMGGGVTLASILNHSAGLVEPNSVSWRMCPPADRWELLQDASADDGPGYSEIVAGLVLEEFIERVTGQPAASFVEERILDPLGISQSVIVSPERALALDVRKRTTVPFSIGSYGCIPLLTERLPCQSAEIRPAFGPLVTAGGLCRLYAALGRVFQGEVVPGLPSPEALRRLLSAVDRHEEKLFRRSCAFSGGFMVELVDHAFGDGISRHAFGRCAGITHSAAFFDPERELAAAYYLNGSILEDTDRAQAIRSAIVSLLLEEVDHVA